MKRSRNELSGNYLKVVREISENIRASRYLAARSANRESLLLYYRTGKLLSDRIALNDWGDAILDVISGGIQKNFPGIRGFSIRNLYNMRQFYDTYSSNEFLQSLTAQSNCNKFLQSTTAETGNPEIGQLLTGQFKSDRRTLMVDVFFQIGFTHHILLLQKCPDFKERVFYMRQAVQNQWSVEVLRYHILSRLYRKRGGISSNFAAVLPQNLKKHALEAFKDEYLLNFINVNEGDGEGVLETELIKNLRDFLMSLGREFAFLGNQYRMVVDDDEFFVDLLFYHRRLQSLIAIELKTGKFKPEYAGKMNFYLEALDRNVKLDNENPSIGIILCKEKRTTVVEFAFKRIDRPMGVATYVLDEKPPMEYRRFLPTPAQLKKAAQKGSIS
jgi:predicted nuclease of restriction endonuclease-like (RecB) superfamily